MKKLILGILLVCTTGRSTATSSSNNPLGCLRADILFIMDWSGTLKAHETKMAGIIAGFNTYFTLAPDGVKIGVVTFAKFPVQYTEITADPNTVDVTASMLATTPAYGESKLYPALAAAPGLFAASRIERNFDALRVVIIVTDGLVDDSFLCRQLTGDLKKQGTIVCVIGIGDIIAQADEFLNSICSPGYMFYKGHFGIAEKLLALDICA